MTNNIMKRCHFYKDERREFMGHKLFRHEIELCSLQQQQNTVKTAL